MSDDDEKPRFAGSHGIATLYKLRRYQSYEERGWVRQIIVEHMVYFAKPSALNDPHDLRPLLELRSYETEEETRRELLADARRTWERRTPLPSAQTVDSEEGRLGSIPLKEFIAEATEKAHRYLERFLVYSLTADVTSRGVWSEYGDNERGLAIHFRSDEMPFAAAQQVAYQPTRPSMLFPWRDQTDAQIAQLATLTKSHGWAHEKEYRWIKYPDRDYTGSGLRFYGQHAFFPATSISGITIGRLMPPSDAAAIRRMAESHNPPLRVLEALPVD